MKTFRYPGVRPFEAADRALFFGRDRDIADLFEMIRAERLVVLFGKSGYGKSSLLNAGVLPRLRSEMTPIEVRLGEFIEKQSLSPVETLRRKTPAPALARPETAFLRDLPASLWTHFKQLDGEAKGSYLLVFDQFEEFFSYPPEQQRAFRDQLADLLSGELPETLREAARPLDREQRRLLAAPMDIRILFAIRSDRLHELDRLKDRLPAILHKRYELKALTREQAREAIVQPALLVGSGDIETYTADQAGAADNSSLITHRLSFFSPPFTYREDALQKILTDLTASNTGQQSGIEAFQLQILCDSIENKVAEGLIPIRDGKGLPEVTAADLPDFTEVFAQYYERRLAQLPENQRAAARRVIEDGLVRYDPETDTARRLSVDGQALLKDFHSLGLSAELLRELENTFLVRREPNTLGGHNYELSHDTLLAPVVRSKKQRLAEEAERLRLAKIADEEARIAREKAEAQRRQRRALLTSVIAGALVLAALGFGLYAFQQSKKAAEAIALSEQKKKEAENSQREAEESRVKLKEKSDEAEKKAAAANEADRRAKRSEEIAALEQIKARTEQENARLMQLKAEAAAEVAVLALLEAARKDILKLDYAAAENKMIKAADLNVLRDSVAFQFMEIAFWNAETKRLDAAKTLAVIAARLLGRADQAAKAEQAADRVALRVVLETLDGDRFKFLENRYVFDPVRIPGGEFMMGSPDSLGESDEHPQHQVRLSAFQLARTETTFWQFGLYATAAGLNLFKDFAPSWGIDGSHPAVNVSWLDAARYANWLSNREGLKPAYIFDGDDFKDIDYAANGYRLPTEAQWEYAARSGGKNEVYAGFSDPNSLYLFANSYEKSGGDGETDQNDGYKYTAPVSSFKTNGLGLYDMTGNVWEWCQDWWSEYLPDEQTNPIGADKGGYRVNRGGSWGRDARDCRAAYRINSSPENRSNYIGFRLSRPPQ